MATYVKFHQFVEDLGKGLHDLNSDTLKLYLTNATPDASTDALKADLAEITAENGYATATVSTTAYSQTSGTASLTGDDYTWTATAGGFGPFRYVVLYNETATGDPLIAYWDYGSAISVADGESFMANFGTNILTIV